MSDVRVESMVLLCCHRHYFWGIRIPLGKCGSWEGGRGEKQVLQLSTISPLSEKLGSYPSIKPFKKALPIFPSIFPLQTLPL